MHLRCKAMMVFGESFEEDPDYQAGNVDFWCLKTAQGVGPDGNLAAMDCCTDPQRTCFQEF
jgi:hypothetical protein